MVHEQCYICVRLECKNHSNVRHLNLNGYFIVILFQRFPPHLLSFSISHWPIITNSPNRRSYPYAKGSFKRNTSSKRAKVLLRCDFNRLMVNLNPIPKERPPSSFQLRLVGRQILNQLPSDWTDHLTEGSSPFSLLVMQIFFRGSASWGTFANAEFIGWIVYGFDFPRKRK